MKTQTSCLIISCSLLLLGCSSQSERQFVGGCQSTGMPRAACQCAYQKLESKYGEQGLKNNLYQIRPTEAFQYDMMQSGLQCMKE